MQRYKGVRMHMVRFNSRGIGSFLIKMDNIHASVH